MQKLFLTFKHLGPLCLWPWLVVALNEKMGCDRLSGPASVTIGWVDGCVRVLVFLGSVHGFAVVLLTDLSGLMASGVGLVARQCAL